MRVCKQVSPLNQLCNWLYLRLGCSRSEISQKVRTDTTWQLPLQKGSDGKLLEWALILDGVVLKANSSFRCGCSRAPHLCCLQARISFSAADSYLLQCCELQDH